MLFYKWTCTIQRLTSISKTFKVSSSLPELCAAISYLSLYRLFLLDMIKLNLDKIGIDFMIPGSIFLVPIRKKELFTVFMIFNNLESIKLIG